jgi:hypothetical protein
MVANTEKNMHGGRRACTVAVPQGFLVGKCKYFVTFKIAGCIFMIYSIALYCRMMVGTGIKILDAYMNA